MSKKHFIALADEIIRIQTYSKEPFSQFHIERLAIFCLSQNPRFNRQRWLDYIAGKCGPNGGKVKQAA